MTIKLDELKNEFVSKIFLLDNLWSEINFYEEENSNVEIDKLSHDILSLLEERISLSLKRKKEILEEIERTSKEILQLNDLLEESNPLVEVSFV